MRLWHLAWLCLPVVLTGCGGDKPAATISVTCGRGTALVGASSIDVLGDQVNGRTVLSFPDPANRGQTGTLVVPPHDTCKINPIVGSGG